MVSEKQAKVNKLNVMLIEQRNGLIRDYKTFGDLKNLLRKELWFLQQQIKRDPVTYRGMSYNKGDLNEIEVLINLMEKTKNKSESIEKRLIDRVQKINRQISTNVRKVAEEN